MSRVRPRQLAAAVGGIAGTTGIIPGVTDITGISRKKKPQRIYFGVWGCHHRQPVDSVVREPALRPRKAGNTIKQNGRHTCRKGEVYEWDHQEVTVMKLSIAAVAAVFVLCSPALAQSDLNGATLGRSQPGVNAGVPYPNTTATDNPSPAVTERTAPVSSSPAKQRGAASQKHHKDSKNSGM
jgi:hypothetical protein